MFRIYTSGGDVGGSAGIKFNDELVLIAGRHPAAVMVELVDAMNAVHVALPNAHHDVIRNFVTKHFDFTTSYAKAAQ